MKFSQRPVLLIFPFGYLSHYLRCLELGKYLKIYFDIKFAYHPQYHPFVSKEGIENFDCASLDEKSALSKVKEYDFTWLNEVELEKVFLSQVEAINEYNPVAVLGDAVPTLKMAAEYTGVQYISLLNGYMSKYYSEIRRMSESHPVYPYLTKLPFPMQNFLITKGEALAFRKIHKPFRKIRSRYRLKLVNNYLEEMEGDKNLLCDLQKLFPLKKLPQNYTSIGPLIYDEVTGSGTTDLQLDGTKKTIFISMGSTGDWNSMQFLNRPEYKEYNIVAAGDKEGVLYADHIIKKDFIAGHEIFPFTDLVICHGGNGTVYQALSYGIPLLCKAVHFEQEWNIKALENAGLGSSLNHIEGSGSFKKIIENWIGRKGNENYKEFENSIKSSLAQIQKKAEKVAETVLSQANILADKNQ